MPRPDASASVTRLECSSFRAVHVERVVVVRWRGLTPRAEFEALGKFVVDAAAAAREKVDLVALVPPLSAVPGPEVFDATVRFGAATRDALGSTHVVLEGVGGFWRTIVQSVTTRATTALGLHGKVGQHPSADAALTQAATRRGMDVDALRAALEREGLLASVPEESGAYARSASDATAVARRTTRP